MSLEHIAGIAIITVAYSILWYFVLRSRSIIEKINENGLKHLREIKRELGLKREKNG